MKEELVKKIATLMTEQTAAFKSLESLTKQLISALIRNEPNNIESLSRAGDTELMRMRSRLLEITTSLTNFSELNRQDATRSQLSSDVRSEFETAAQKMLEAAREYQKLSKRTENLALGGSSFATACIQFCGIPATTYRPPVLKYATGVPAR
ncbi:MAG: hypothetical protein JSS81_00800 [Acidobacteria bacterium]|nr:hypothetical protein [Acidobacteriota bacterium]